MLGRGGSYRSGHPFGPATLTLSDNGRRDKHAFRTRGRAVVERYIKRAYLEAQWVTLGPQLKFIRDSGPPQTHEEVKANSKGWVLAPRTQRRGHACEDCDHPLCMRFRSKLALTGSC